MAKTKRPTSKTPPAKEQHPTTRIVSWTVLAITLCALVGWGWLFPLLTAAPMAYYLIRMRDGGSRPLVVRWAATVIVMTMVASAFAGEEYRHGIPFGDRMVTGIDTWLASGGAPPFSVLAMLGIAVAAIVLGLVSAGVGTCVVIAGAMGAAALVASRLYANGYNGIQVTFIALSPWVIALVAGLLLLLNPIARLSFARVIRRGDSPGDGVDFRRDRDLMIGAGLIVAALVLRLAFGGLYTELVKRWTIF